MARRLGIGGAGVKVSLGVRVMLAVGVAVWLGVGLRVRLALVLELGMDWGQRFQCHAGDKGRGHKIRTGLRDI